MIQKERILDELNIKSFETKNENNWNEQTILTITYNLSGIINFPLPKLDDNMFNHIKAIIQSIESLEKITRNRIQENWEKDEKKDILDVLSVKMKHDSIYLRFIIFYSDLTFRLKYKVKDNCKEQICPNDYHIGFNFTKDLTIESMFSELYPVHLYFDFNDYPIHNSKMWKISDENYKTPDIDRVKEEINLFNNEYPHYAYDNPTSDNMYERYPQRKSVSVTVSLNKIHRDYNAGANYAQREPFNPDMDDSPSWIIVNYFRFKGIGVLRTNNIYPIKWLKKHNQEYSGVISIPVKNKESLYINCEIQNYRIKKMEIIEDADTCIKLGMDINEETSSENIVFNTRFP
jgi:hypothetical protein